MPTAVFDVNETLLDLRVLDAPFQDALGAADARAQWFQQLLELAFTCVATDAYTDFGTLARAALRMCADRERVTLDRAAMDRLLGRLRRLPPHAEVPAALQSLHAAGWQLLALSNGTPEALQAQLRHAGLAPLFAGIVSVDEARQLKPGPKPYRLVTERYAIDPAAAYFVAAHVWDLAGARRAGYQTVFVQRAGKVPNPLDASHALAAPSLMSLAEALLDRS
ncbi:haloacid dehalogenase type II [Salisaeta longa]|uniref:haloacid dehalogenase type II n=1 Tax=Salisaeta longa TaxID=503170 RepID=UPI0003B4ED85|nr:haloacid dehalogenase type II [Salisaeta longa]